jgi:hypothetical protein
MPWTSTRRWSGLFSALENLRDEMAFPSVGSDIIWSKAKLMLLAIELSTENWKRKVSGVKWSDQAHWQNNCKFATIFKFLEAAIESWHLFKMLILQEARKSVYRGKEPCRFKKKERGKITFENWNDSQNDPANGSIDITSTKL